ncbi:MarR family winged helix-turn-helix transcriptional regulator [Agarivorans sp. MS3-6]
MAQQQSVDHILHSTKLNWPEAYQGISSIILRTVRANAKFVTLLESVIGQYGLQGADFGVLVTLRRHPAPYCLSPTELYSAMLFSSGGLTKVLTRITNAGLVERINNPDDKRSKLVRLTEQGKVLIEQVTLELHEQEQATLSVLSQQEQQQLDQLLRKLAGS